MCSEQSKRVESSRIPVEFVVCLEALTWPACCVFLLPFAEHLAALCECAPCATSLPEAVERSACSLQPKGAPLRAARELRAQS